MAVCDTPNTICNQFNLQDPLTQRYLLIHLLASTLGVTTDDGELQTLAAGYLCQGSPAKLRTEEATAIAAADLPGVDLSHITCWDPLQLEAVMAYLTCVAIDAL